MTETKRVKCIYCKKDIHIKHFGAVTKKGIVCDNSFCLLELAKELK